MLNSNGISEKKNQLSHNNVNQTFNTIVEQEIQKINEIIENPQFPSQKKLKISQIRNLKKEIKFLVEKGKEFFSQAITRKEKEYNLEIILTLIAKLFEDINVNRLFVSKPNICLSDYHGLKLESKLFRLLVPNGYNIDDLDSVLGGNCHMLGVLLYYDILKQITCSDKDINFSFFIKGEDSHGVLVINDLFLIDSTIEIFLKVNHKMLEKRYFCRLGEDELLEELLKNYGTFSRFENIDDYIKKINNTPFSDKIGALLNGEVKTSINYRRRLGLNFIYFKYSDYKALCITLNSNDKKGNLNTDLDFILDRLGSNEDTKNIAKSLVSKINNKTLIRHIYGKQNFSINIHSFLLKILDFKNIMNLVKKLFS